MKLHRQQPRAQVNRMSRPQDRQRVAPRPVQAVEKWLQKARQHSRRVRWFGGWMLRTMQAKNFRG